ncbi:MAG: nucleotidyltransferase domain-containing protein [Anaerolineae bacterium]|nr:nucleotidyltransferase domain-containing protein [Anaerolineae bacterium]
MVPEITTEKMTIYQAAARQRRQRQAQQVILRYQQAREVVREAHQILIEQFGASQVAMFGSILSLERFHQHSDVDLVVWGLNEGVYYRAVGRLLSLDTTIPVDLLEAELASPALLAVIEREAMFL